MKERTFKLDDLGIIPYDGETEENFIKRGDKYLHLSKSKDFLEDVVDEPGNELITLQSGETCELYEEIKKTTIKSSAKKVAKYSDYDLSWVKGFYAKVPIGIDGITLYNEKAPAAKIKIPPFILVDQRLLFFTSKKWSFLEKSSRVIPSVKDILSHELMHCARHFTGKRVSDEFEETFCDLLEGPESRFEMPFHGYGKEKEKKLLICYKKLQDVVAEKAGYVLGRLKEKDVTKINKIKKPKDYIKKANSLRFKIITEKLGL